MSILCLLNVCALPVAFMLYKQKIADTENAALNAGLNTNVWDYMSAILLSWVQ